MSSPKLCCVVYTETMSQSAATRSVGGARSKALKAPTPVSAFRSSGMTLKRVGSTPSAKENVVPLSLAAKRLKVDSFATGKASSLKRSSSTTLHAPSRPSAASSASQTGIRAATSTTSLAPSSKGSRKAWDLKGRVTDLEELVQSLCGDKHHLSQQNKDANEQLENFRKENAELKLQVQDKDKLVGELASTKRLLESTREEADTALARAERLAKEKTSLEQTILELTTSTAGLRTQNAAVSAMYEQAETERKSLQTLVEQLKTQCAKLEADLESSEAARRDLHNDLLELKGNIRVFCRMRPLLPAERQAGEVQATISFPDQKSVEVVKLDPQTSRPKTLAFTFDKVFPETAQQAEVYTEVSHLVQSALDGYNVCIFAYGQTGSGKTFTMEGPDYMDLGDADLVGLIPRALHQVFHTAQKLKEQHWVYTMVATVLEVYNEEIRDLLSPSQGKKLGSGCQLKTSRQEGSVTVSNVTEMKVTSPDEIYQLLARARKNRSTGATECNEHSSRSHCVFRLHITGANTRSGSGRRATLSLVDLAGSERLSQSKSEGVRLQETKNINKSLSNLGNVILALSKKADHVPYRNSKLTHLLMDSLGGNSKTLMLLNISPKEDNLGETLSSLRFASKVNQCNIGMAQQSVQV